MKKILQKIADLFDFEDVTEDTQYDIPLTIKEVYSLHDMISCVPESSRGEDISNVLFMLEQAIEHYEATSKV